MPLFFSGIVAIESIQTATNVFPIKSTGVVAVAAGTDALKIRVSSWPDEHRGITAPQIGHMYLIEGKFSYDAMKSEYVVETARIIPLPSEIEPVAPRLTGTAVFSTIDTKNQDLLKLHSSCYAASVATDCLHISAECVGSQYQKFIAKLKANREISVTGVMCSAGKAHIFLAYADFSFLSKQVTSEALGGSAAQKSTVSTAFKKALKLQPKDDEKQAATEKDDNTALLEQCDEIIDISHESTLPPSPHPSEADDADIKSVSKRARRSKPKK